MSVYRALALLAAIGGQLAPDAPRIEAQPLERPIVAVEAGLLPHGSHPEAWKVYLLVSREVRAEGLDWGLGERLAMVELCWRESRFVATCQDPRSTAAGLYGFLDATASRYGGRTYEPLAQTRQAVLYVRDRYGSAKKSLAFWEANGWY